MIVVIGEQIQMLALAQKMYAQMEEMLNYKVVEDKGYQVNRVVDMQQSIFNKGIPLYL